MAELYLDHPNPWISKSHWKRLRDAARILKARGFRTVLGSKEMDDEHNPGHLKPWARGELVEILSALAGEGFGLDITLADDAVRTTLQEALEMVAKYKLPYVAVTSANEPKQLKPGAGVVDVMNLVGRIQWLQQIAWDLGFSSGTPVVEGWFGDWIPDASKPGGGYQADTCEFGIELHRHMNMIDHVWSPGPIRNAIGFADPNLNCYVSRLLASISRGLIWKVEALDKLIHGTRPGTGYNKNQIVLSEFGVWLPPKTVQGGSKTVAREVAIATREVKKNPRIKRVTWYVPSEDPHYSLFAGDGYDPRFDGYRAGLGV